MSQWLTADIHTSLSAGLLTTFRFNVDLSRFWMASLPSVVLVADVGVG